MAARSKLRAAKNRPSAPASAPAAIAAARRRGSGSRCPISAAAQSAAPISPGSMK
jgi:hypothetical protein